MEFTRFYSAFSVTAIHTTKKKKICITLIVKGETKTAQASTRSYAVLAEGDASTTHLVNGTRFSVYTAICVSAASYYLFKRMLFFSE